MREDEDEAEGDRLFIKKKISSFLEFQFNRIIYELFQNGNIFLLIAQFTA